MSGSTQPPRLARFQVSVERGARRETIVLEEGRDWIIGRSDECSICIDDPSVSRQHARLLPQTDGVSVEDLGSKNGTWLAHSAAVASAPGVGAMQRVAPQQRVRLRVGGAVRVGDVSVFLEWVGGRPAPAAMPGAPVLAVSTEPVMLGVFHMLERAASGELSVLIIGEVGVGKQAVAQWLHAQSPRAGGPFAVLNCAAPEAVLERALFGVAATTELDPSLAQTGLLEDAAGGTLFLKEIGDLPRSLQARLLHALEEQSVSRLGGVQTSSIDVRVITATRRDLLAEVHSGRFRADLYYRISGLSIRVPPLRERLGDVEALARHFLEQVSTRADGAPVVGQDALLALRQHTWPGNVRELRNVIERAALIADGGVVQIGDIVLDVLPSHAARPSVPDEGSPQGPISDGAPPQPPSDAERERLVAALEACAGNQRRAAAMLGISRRTLVSRLNKWKLPRPRKKDPAGNDAS